MRYKISSLRQIVLFLSAWNNCNDKKSLGMFKPSFFINPRKEISIVCCFLLEPLNEIIWLCKIWFVWHRKNNYVYLWIVNGKFIIYSMKSWNVALSQQISCEIFRFYKLVDKDKIFWQDSNLLFVFLFYWFLYRYFLYQFSFFDEANRSNGRK